MAGAINEILDFEIGIRASSKVVGVALEFEPLSSQTAGQALPPAHVYRVLRVKVPSWPGWHIRARSADQREPNPWDVLVPIYAPIDGIPQALNSGQAYRFWVDIPIPKGTPPGAYMGRLVLTGQGRPLGSINVQLTVWPFVLPDNPSPAIIADVDQRALATHLFEQGGGRSSNHSHHEVHAQPKPEPLGALLTSTLRMLHQHRIAPTLSGLAPLVTPHGSGSLSVDWQAYDEIVSPVLSGQLFSDRLASQYWPISMAPVAAAWRTGLRNSRGPQSVSSLVGVYLSETMMHLQQRGWLSKYFLPLAPDLSTELRTSQQLDDMLPALLEKLGPVELLSNRGPQDLAPYGWIGYPANSVASLVAILMPPAQFYDSDTMAKQREQGKRTWLAMDRPPFSGTTAIQGLPVDARILAWQGLRLGAEVVHIGVVNAWPVEAGHHRPDDCILADSNTLIFPGDSFGLTEPIPTVRLKRLRQGLQDVAYLQLMYDQGLGHVATTLLETLVPPSGAAAYRSHFADGEPIRWPASIKSFEAARRVMASEILQRMDRTESNPKLPFAINAAWRRLMMTMRRVELSIEGVRVRDSGSSGRGSTALTCVVRIVNRSRIPVSGTLRFRDLPDFWHSIQDHQAIEHLLPDESRLIRLSASQPAFASALIDAPPLDIEFISEGEAPVHAVAHISVTMAQPLTRPITIDGNMSDWPSGSLNVARAYTPIGASPLSAVGDPRLPQTVSFFARDQEFLYIAIHCTLAKNRQPPAIRGKRIIYDDLIPVGEDLVEILFDPLNSESRSPGDLLHVVVKYSGVDLVEKGIETTPPCCAHEPWPVKIDIESRVSSGRWTTELRVPLADLGIGPSDSVVVGMNITRFDAEHENYYTWSGARQTAYDPLSLGNLFIPPMPAHAQP